MSVRFVPCPHCGTQVAWTPANKYRPFCSDRCRLIDLGAWANEDYRVPVPQDRADPDAGESE